MGSNIDPEANLKAAAGFLRDLWPTIKFSSVYRSPATERPDQPDFLNAAACFESDESPEEIHTKLQTIEATLKKNPPYRFGPRTIDLDLLLYGSKILPSIQEWLPNKQPETRNQKLVLPHPRLHERRFVLEPLTELGAGNLLHPELYRTLKSYLPDVEEQECESTGLIL